VESEPLWNKVSDAQLKAMLAKHGIRHDTTVILYGRDVYAAPAWRRSCCTPG
jgi:thiosulfate/3-mercaptopyruvate sulfurtransferase